MATERLNDVWLVGTTWWEGCRELLLQENCFCKAMAVSQAFIFYFKWYSILHFAVCQLLCWAFLFLIAIVMFHISHHFQDSRCRNIHDFHLQNGSRSYVLMQIESQDMTSYLMAIVLFFIFVIISNIFIVELYMTCNLTFIMGRGQI